MLNVRSLLQAHSISPRGVIHVGAHEGQELATYREIGFRRVLFVEANPDVFRRLESRMRHEPGVTVVNVAVSDRAGTAEFNITSMDQSSSILPLKAHAEIYPSITVVNRISVRTSTLDGLLDELGFSAADFNFLHLDIQGAELMALRGANRCLQHIEAVNTEVNFAELYSGCGLIGAIEEHLGSHGLNRIGLARPYHPTWGDAFYVRRPLVTMTSLGEQAPLASQMLRYLFLRLIARRHGAVVQTPPWPGRAIFGLEDQDLMRSIGCTEHVAPGGLADWLGGRRVLDGDLNFTGAVPEHTRLLVPHREFIRQLFRFEPTVRPAFERILTTLRASAPMIVALHIGRGDYGHEEAFEAPLGWYREWLEGMSKRVPGLLVYLCSECPDRIRPGLDHQRTIIAAEIRNFPPHLRFLLDFHMLAEADAVAVSSGQFSFLAAMLNARAHVFVRPDPQAQRLVEFSPWDAPVTLGPQPKPQDAGSPGSLGTVA